MSNYNIDLSAAVDAADYIKNQFKQQLPEVAVILGSGLGGFTKIVKVLASIKYVDIPSFPQGHVKGHKGQLSLAQLDNGKQVLVMEGRFHYYEGFSPQEITLPIVVFHLLGIKKLIVSNAAGGINPNFKAGDLMIINDHINLTGNHPLIGSNNDKLGLRFLDQTEPYCNKLISLAKDIAAKLELVSQEGVYIAVSGPTYETKAEIRAFSMMGADAVGMSTVYEVMMANYLGIKVLGISSITNMATGLALAKHDHNTVVAVANQISDAFSNWVKQIIIAL